MDDDLISRKELRKAFKESGYFTGPWLHWARLLIDVAPTVDPYQGEECLNIKMSDKEIKEFKKMLQEHAPLSTYEEETENESRQ